MHISGCPRAPGSCHRVGREYKYGRRHVYDVTGGCFQLRHKRHESSFYLRFAGTHAPLNQNSASTSASTAPRAGISQKRRGGCRCSLDLDTLFESSDDVPTPQLPLSKCEYHEILRALPPQLQSCPWRLRFDSAKHGYSLAHFYVKMEEVRDEQACGLGFFVVSEQQEAPPSSTSPSEAIKTSVEEGRALGGRSSTAGGRNLAPLGVIGCFTPIVPCATRQSVHGWCGSPETFVFRVNIRDTPQRCVRGSHGPTDAKLHTTAANHVSMHSVPGGVSDMSTTPLHLLLNTETLNVPLSTRDGTLGSKNENVTLPEPIVTRSTEREVAGNFSPTSVSRSSVSSMSGSLTLHGGNYPTDSLPASVAGARYSTVSPPPRSHKRTVVEVFRWTGDSNHREFMSCHPTFLSIGGGRYGAALTVDRNMEHGTSSAHCETFKSPSLYDTPESTLSHSEFAILRMVWFSVEESRSRHANAVSTFLDVESTSSREDEELEEAEQHAEVESTGRPLLSCHRGDAVIGVDRRTLAAKRHRQQYLSRHMCDCGRHARHFSSNVAAHLCQSDDEDFAD